VKTREKKTKKNSEKKTLKTFNNVEVSFSNRDSEVMSLNAVLQGSIDSTFCVGTNRTRTSL